MNQGPTYQIRKMVKFKKNEFTNTDDVSIKWFLFRMCNELAIVNGTEYEVLAVKVCEYGEEEYGKTLFATAFHSHASYAETPWLELEAICEWCTKLGLDDFTQVIVQDI